MADIETLRAKLLESHASREAAQVTATESQLALTAAHEATARADAELRIAEAELAREAQALLPTESKAVTVVVDDE